MYANIVVLTYQSPDIDYHTYEIPEELEDKIKIGQLVSVPFGKRNPQGIVLETGNKKPDTRYALKKISSVVLEKPILLPYQIKLLIWMSSYYIAPMLNCLEAMLPEIPKRLDKFQISNFKFQISAQTLILIPSINHLPQTLANFPQAKNHVVYTNELKVSQKFEAWQKILSGQCDFIFGSRSAIFAPCPNLKKIIIFDEHDGAYKDSRSPYFDTLTVAEKIFELTGAKIELVDSSPRITTFYNSIRHSDPELVEGEESRSFSLRLQDDKVKKVQTKTISLANDRKLGNYSPISIPLEEIIKRAYAKNLSILLFLNKKIESGSIYCKNCKHQEFFKSQPEICPNCKSPEIFFNSTNINSLAKEVKKILPDSTINIFAEGLKSTVNGSPRFASEAGQVSIVTIATSSVFYKLMTHKYDLVAHIYADSPLNFNQYNSTEEIYSQIINLKKLTKKLLVIQTYNEDLPAIKFAASGNYEAFYKSELTPRKTLNYPPYSLLVKITVTGKKEDPTEQKAEDYKNKLERLLTTHLDFRPRKSHGTVSPLPPTILGPYKTTHQKTLSYNITLKIPLNDYSLTSREKAQGNISPLFSSQKDVRIIVEPKNLN